VPESVSTNAVKLDLVLLMAMLMLLMAMLMLMRLQLLELELELLLSLLLLLMLPSLCRCCCCWCCRRRVAVMLHARPTRILVGACCRSQACHSHRESNGGNMFTGGYMLKLTALAAAAAAELLAALAAVAAAELMSTLDGAEGAAELLAASATAELLAAAATAGIPYESDEYAADVTRTYVPLPSLLPRPETGMMGTGLEGSSGFMSASKPVPFFRHRGWTSTVLPSPRRKEKSTISAQKFAQPLSFAATAM
jgi:hypothetical protein